MQKQIIRCGAKYHFCFDFDENIFQYVSDDSKKKNIFFLESSETYEKKIINVEAIFFLQKIFSNNFEWSLILSYEIKIANIGKQFFHRLKNIAHLFGQKTQFINFWGTGVFSRKCPKSIHNLVTLNQISILTTLFRSISHQMEFSLVYKLIGKV